jgi:hypothetical protein
MCLYNIRGEGKAIKQGLNFYPKDDASSAGLIIRIGRAICWIRWSKVSKEWFANFDITPKGETVHV